MSSNGIAGAKTETLNDSASHDFSAMILQSSLVRLGLKSRGRQHGALALNYNDNYAGWSTYHFHRD